MTTKATPAAPSSSKSERETEALPPALQQVAEAMPGEIKLPNYGPYVDGLVINSPSNGLTVHPGDVIQVSVSAINGFVPTNVMVSTSFDSKTIGNPPYTTTLTVPMEFLGDAQLSVGAFDASWAVAGPEPLTIHVVLPPTVTLTSLAVQPEYLALYDDAPERHVSVYGTFSDGIERDLSSPTFGTQFEIADTEIATVDENGLITAVSPGETKLTIRNGAVSTIVPVHVKFEKKN